MQQTEKQSIYSSNGVKNKSNFQLLSKGRKRIVLKYGTIVDVPSEYQNIIEELQKISG